MSVSLAREGNTKVYQENGSTKVVLHGTVIVAFNSHRVILNSNGWRTVTTKQRMNQASKEYGLGFTVYQRNWEWYVRPSKSPANKCTCFDGVHNLHFEDLMELPLQ